ncbi:DUF6765 family protein [Desulfosporosinus burensis]
MILDILSDVFHERDLIKLGIVLHAYADTFAHQGFSGMVSKVNDIKSCEALSNNLIYKSPMWLLKTKQKNQVKVI